MSDTADAPLLLDAFRKALLTWYDANRRDLPWRRGGDPYAIWLSEVMLQQTQVATVIPYFQRWLARFPDLETLASAERESVLKSWEGLGYYSRARHFHEAARQVVAEHDGRVPDAYALFRALPGVGDYIAAAVQSIAFQAPYAVVDGNVKRVLARLLRMDEPANAPAGKRAFQERADILLDRDRPGDYNQALMELGATVCRPRNPRCDACPVGALCRARVDGVVAEYPRRLQRKRVPLYRVTAGVIRNGDRVLVVRRPEGKLLGGLWEFPGGIRDGGNGSAADLERLLTERFGIHAGVGEVLGEVRHAYSHFRIAMTVFACTAASGEVFPQRHDAFRWVLPAELGGLPLPRAHIKALALLDHPRQGRLDLG